MDTEVNRLRKQLSEYKTTTEDLSQRLSTLQETKAESEVAALQQEVTRLKFACDEAFMLVLGKNAETEHLRSSEKEWMKKEESMEATIASLMKEKAEDCAVLRAEIANLKEDCLLATRRRCEQSVYGASYSDQHDLEAELQLRPGEQTTEVQELREQLIQQREKYEGDIQGLRAEVQKWTSQKNAWKAHRKMWPRAVVNSVLETFATLEMEWNAQKAADRHRDINHNA